MIFNCQLESKTGKANTRMIIFGFGKNTIAGISSGKKMIVDCRVRN